MGLRILLTVPVVLSALLLGAHHLRAGEPGLVAVCLAAPLLMLSRRAWIPPVLGGLLIIGAFEWVHTAIRFVQIRMMIHEPWTRLAVILGAVALLTGASALVFSSKTLSRRFTGHPDTRTASATAFFLTALGLGVVQVKVAIPMLLVERFLPSFGWFEIFALSVYAAWITEKLLEPNRMALWRKRLWIGFSIVFFLQLAMGLAGVERFLMTGDLHLPVPALIAAGPLYRGYGFFMPVLFGVTLLLVGPAWCSYLCYIGAWDHAASLGRKKPRALPAWTRPLRWGILVLVLGIAVLLRLAGASAAVAGGVALGFGAVGVAVMIIWSRRTGAMVHCTVFCPIGLIANWMGKISPFRVQIKDGCDQCLKCKSACRYDALNRSDIENRKPGLTCTLCGDCLASCKEQQIGYRFFKFDGAGVRIAFAVLVGAVHAIFLGVARM